MIEEGNFHLPDVHIDWDRPVAAEELYNLSRDIPRAHRDLETAAHRFSETGTPVTICYDDLDRDTIVTVPADWDMIEKIDFALMKGTELLAKQGVVFEPGYENRGDST